MPRPADMLAERVVRIISAHLPRELPAEAELAEFGLDGGSILELIVAREPEDRGLYPSSYPPQLDGETGGWRTFQDVQVSCQRHNLVGVVLGCRGCLIMVKPDLVTRNTCRFPLDFDLTRVGLDDDRRAKIHRELTYGDGRDQVAVCTLFPMAELQLCATPQQIIRLALVYNRWPELVAELPLAPQVA
jgi:hypothetical protein